MVTINATIHFESKDNWKVDVFDNFVYIEAVEKYLKLLKKDRFNLAV